jgi:hypothetical protein
MKKALLLLVLSGYFTYVCSQPKRRSDSFFGIHFDFHATMENKEIGKTFDAATVDSFLTIVKPDFVQVDCKGHPGCSSYPTKVGNQAGGYTKDILKIWREETAKHNVALYVHYSGLWDKKAIGDHPEWGRVTSEGKHDNEKAAYYGPYSDELLIPQLKEISDYGVNGAWIDGECWATNPDYSPELLEKFHKVTGIANVPKSDADPDYKAFIEFNRTAFRDYLRKYIDAIHAYNPAFQVTSNWSFSSMMPEPVDVNVDYLSGDVAGQNCVYNAAFQARCLALQGKPWDLMSWGFTYDFVVGMGGPKSLIQLEQEAAEINAMGGGYQCYWTQNDDGSIKPWYFPLMGELGKFCRESQPFSKGAEAVPQIALWYSTYSERNMTSQIYGWNIRHLEGDLSLLLDGQNNVEILMDHQIMNKMDRYPMIVIPEWTNLDTKLKKQVLVYVEKGGNLLVIGAAAVREFEPQLGVTFVDSVEKKNFYLGFKNRLTMIEAPFQSVNPKEGTQIIGGVYKTDDFRFPAGYPVATIASLGKGKIAGVYMDMGEAYYSYQASGYSKIMNEVIRNMFLNPLVQVKGSDYIHSAINRKDGKWYIHIINTAGSHFNSKVYEYDNIPATGDLQIEICQDKPVKKVLLQPEGKQLDFVREKGKYIVTVPSVKVRSIIEVEF